MKLRISGDAELPNMEVCLTHACACLHIQHTQLPQPATINPAILTATDPDDAAMTVSMSSSYDGSCYVSAPAEESAVDDFAVLLLCALATLQGQGFKVKEGHPLIFV